MIGHLVILLFAFQVTECWILEVNKNTLKTQLTTNVTLYCHHEADDINSPTITELYRIRITKFNRNNEWETMAEKSHKDHEVKSSLVDAKVSVYLDMPSNTFMKICFDIATKDAIGQFLCEIDGFDDSGNVKVIRTRPILITESTISNEDIVKRFLVLQEQQDRNNAELKKLIDTQFNDMWNAIDNITCRVEGIKNDINDIQKPVVKTEQSESTVSVVMAAENLAHRVEDVNNNIMNEISKVNNSITSLTDGQINLLDTIHIFHQNDISWPSGPFTLLKPKTGCPNSKKGFTWELSSVRISTQPGYKNKDTSSTELSLSGNVFQFTNGNRYVNMEMCSMVSKDQGHTWPKGSYCIQVYSYSGNMKDADCPVGFQIGFIRFGRYHDGSSDTVSNIAGIQMFNGDDRTFIIYCCRQDADAINPVFLPSQQPFILYRFGGTCQNVVGMGVASQWIQMDVGKWGTSNQYYLSQKNPDGHADNNGVRIEFCYYRPLS